MISGMIASELWKKGEYTDDTQMALLIAESLLQNKGYVASYIAHPDSSAGNGALMRCAPVALFTLNSPEMLVDISRASARVTHHDPKAQSSCVILNVWIRAAICQGVRDGRSEALALLKDSERSPWHRLERIETYKEDEIRSSGYTVHTLEAAAWSFLTTESFEEAVIRAANLGDDADTVGAVCGSLAGAYYGYAAIPHKWRNQLKDEARIRETALALGRCADETLSGE
jgi:ADP-ribosyl-[dinitrogen reductase] hydrolase